MEFLDRLLGKPTMAGLAAAIIKEVKNAGETADLQFEADANRIVHATDSDDNWTFNLANIYQTYKTIPRAQRQAFIRGTVQSILVTKKKLPDDFDLVKADIRPRLWLRASFEQMRLRSLLESDDMKPLDLPTESVGDHLLLSLAYDWPHAVQSVNGQNLETWNVSFYEAMEVARDNLTEATLGYAHIGKHFYAFMSGDTYDASRIALINRVESLEVIGKHVAMVPNRETLLITGSEDDANLQILVSRARDALKEPYPLCGLPLILEDGQWQDWEIPADFPSALAFQQLKIAWLAPLYDQQETDLKLLFQKQGQDIFVARFFILENNQDGRVLSWCVWSRGVESLLPVTDRVAFFKSEDCAPIFASWSAVTTACGHFMHLTDDYPHRYRVSEFPDDAILEKIGSPSPV
jgi:hypothetical protein